MPSNGSSRKDLFKSDWSIDTVTIEGTHLRATGWYSAPAGARLDILVNGVIADVEYHHRSDLAQMFGFLLPERTVLAFVATVALPPVDEYKFELSTPAATVDAYYYPANQTSERSIPSPDRIKRVRGIADVSNFKTIGFTHYKIISSLLVSFSEEKNTLRVLDWGCGCGSTGRYFLSAPRFVYVGCDVDHDNLDWCRQNLDGDSFFQVPLAAPRCELTPGQPFDCIFGVSVISHLSHNSIVKWSRWLSLNLKPRGLLLLTTLGLQAAAQTNADVTRHLADHGIIFSEDRQHPIGEIIGDRSFYGISFQSPAFLEKVFSDDFELIYFKQGGIGLQDIVIFRRKERAFLLRCEPSF